MPAPPDLDAFRAARLRLTCVADEPIALEPFAGSTFRGALGERYRASVCTRALDVCDGCDRRTTCDYPTLFEPAPPPGSTRLSGIDRIPPGYVVEAPWFDGASHRFDAGDRFDVGLVLFGDAIVRGPALVDTLADVGGRGVGPDRGRYRVESVSTTTVDSNGIAARVEELAGAPLVIDFATPLRVKVDGRFVREPSFGDLVRALLRRTSSVIAFSCAGEMVADFRGLIGGADRVATGAATFDWRTLHRISGRQHRRVEMGGVVGRASYGSDDPDALAPFLPLFAAGEWLHVGKGAVMGLGRVVCNARG